MRSPDVPSLPGSIVTVDDRSYVPPRRKISPPEATRSIATGSVVGADSVPAALALPFGAT